MNKLVIERIVDCGEHDSISKGICNNSIWHDICDYEKEYILSNLLNEGWEIVNTSVSTSSCSSHSGYRTKYDHTILMLEKNQNDKNTL